MKFKDIVVSGIDNIVLDRKAQWSQLPSNDWRKHNTKADTFEVRTHEQMMDVVAHLKVDRRYRMWIHGSTLNIVRK